MFSISGLALDASNTVDFVVWGTTLAAGAGLNLAVSTAPVPEPETWAMLLAGLGLLRVAATRRLDQDARPDSA